MVAQNFLVDMIPVNNAQHSEEESTSGGHYTHEAFQKWQRKAPPILQEALIFTRLE